MSVSSPVTCPRCGHDKPIGDQFCPDCAKESLPVEVTVVLDQIDPVTPEVTPVAGSVAVTVEPAETAAQTAESAPAPASEPIPAATTDPEPALDTIRFVSYRVNVHDNADQIQAQRQISELVAAGWQIKGITGDLWVTVLLTNLPKQQPQRPEREERAAERERPARPAFVKIPRQEEKGPVSSFVLNGISLNHLPDEIDLESLTSKEATTLFTQGKISREEFDDVCNREIKHAARRGYESVDKFTPITSLKKGSRREPAASK